MKKQGYGDKIKDPRWQQMRLRVMERDGWRCVICNAGGETLNVHHRRYAQTGNPWDVAENDVHTLCETCHALFHDRHDMDTRTTEQRTREAMDRLRGINRRRSSEAPEDER